jgi:hypothetical protein
MTRSRLKKGAMNLQAHEEEINKGMWRERIRAYRGVDGEGARETNAGEDEPS